MKIVLELASDIVLDTEITFEDKMQIDILDMIMQISRHKPYIIQNASTRFNFHFNASSSINLVRNFARKAKEYEIQKHFTNAAIVLSHKKQEDTDKFLELIMSTVEIENLAITYLDQDVKFEGFDHETMNLNCIKSLEFYHEANIVDIGAR